MLSLGQTCEQSAQPKSDLYLGLLPVVNAGTIELPDIPELIRELLGLERRRGPSGKDRCDHGPGGFDDRANVVAGLAALFERQPGFGVEVWFDDDELLRRRHERGLVAARNSPWG